MYVTPGARQPIPTFRRSADKITEISDRPACQLTFYRIIPLIFVKEGVFVTIQIPPRSFVVLHT